jgi:hypothetical protein
MYALYSSTAVVFTRNAVKNVAGLSIRRPRFDPRPVHVGFVMDKVALGQYFCFLPLSIITPMLHIPNDSFIHSFVTLRNLSQR